MLNMARMRREFCCSAGSFTLRGIVAKWILLPPWGSAQSSALPGLVHPVPRRHSCRRPLPHRAVASSADTLGYSRNIMDTFPPTGRTTVRRLPQRGVYDKARVYATPAETLHHHVVTGPAQLAGNDVRAGRCCLQLALQPPSAVIPHDNHNRQIVA